MAKFLTAAGIRKAINRLSFESALTIAGATNASPSVVNITGHGASVGDVHFVSGTTGNTALNGMRTVATVVDADHLTYNDFFTAAEVDGNGVTGGSPTAQRVKIGSSPDDLEDLLEMCARSAAGATGRFKDSDRPNANEKVVATVLGQ